MLRKITSSLPPPCNVVEFYPLTRRKIPPTTLRLQGTRAVLIYIARWRPRYLVPSLEKPLGESEHAESKSHCFAPPKSYRHSGFMYIEKVSSIASLTTEDAGRPPCSGGRLAFRTNAVKPVRRLVVSRQLMGTDTSLKYLTQVGLGLSVPSRTNVAP